MAKDATAYMQMARMLVLQQCVIDKQTETIKKMQTLIEDFSAWKPSAGEVVATKKPRIIIP